MASTTLNPTVDTYLQNDAADTNYDSNTAAYIGESNAAANRVRRWLCKFDFSSIPSNAIISSAVLELYADSEFSSSAGESFDVYRVLRNWVSSQATWNVYSTGNSWGTAGCGDTTTDREATSIGSLALGDVGYGYSLNEYKSWTLDASKVQEWIRGTFTNYGIIIKTAGEANDMWAFESLEHSDGHDPRLTLVYTVPSSGAIIF